MSVNLLHCARCKRRTDTIWREGTTFCGVCGSSRDEMRAEMASAGLSTAGPWDYCPMCQDRRYYEGDGEALRCESCHLTMAEAEQKDSERPLMIKYRPSRVTSGALVELQYWCGRPLQPALLMIRWFPEHGTTTVRLDPSQEREDANRYTLSIEVPHGATRGEVTDRTGRSRRCNISIDYVSEPNMEIRKKWWQRLIS